MHLSDTVKAIRKDLINHGGITLLGKVRLYLYDARFRLLLNYRIGSLLRNSNISFFKLLANFYRYKQVTKRGCEISYKADIGNVKFIHPIGITIGEGVKIGNGCEIYQHVTLGTHGKEGLEFNYPIIEENVKVYTGSIIIGGVRIGANAIIGANSLVLKNVPAGCLAVGSPAIIKSKNK